MWGKKSKGSGEGKVNFKLGLIWINIKEHLALKQKKNIFTCTVKDKKEMKRNKIKWKIYINILDCIRDNTEIRRKIVKQTTHIFLHNGFILCTTFL